MDITASAVVAGSWGARANGKSQAEEVSGREQ